MRYQLIISSRAARHIALAEKFYLAKSVSAADHFLHEVEYCIRMIASIPEAFPLYNNALRRKLVDQFPYAIYYFFDRQKAVIAVKAVLHQLQNPDFIRRELANE